jgi:hypothetical protein
MNLEDKVPLQVGPNDGVPRRNSHPHQVNPRYLAVEVDTKIAHERGTCEDHGLGCCHYYNS